MFYKIEVAVAETAISFCNGYGETLHFLASPACRMDHVTEFCQWNIPKVLSLLLGLANENPSTVLPAFSLSQLQLTAEKENILGGAEPHREGRLCP